MEVPEDDPEAEKPFYGPNVWPEDGNHIGFLLIGVSCKTWFKEKNFLIFLGYFFGF